MLDKFIIQEGLDIEHLENYLFNFMAIIELLTRK